MSKVTIGGMPVQNDLAHHALERLRAQRFHNDGDENFTFREIMDIEDAISPECSDGTKKSPVSSEELDAIGREFRRAFPRGHAPITAAILNNIRFHRLNFAAQFVSVSEHQKIFLSSTEAADFIRVIKSEGIASCVFVVIRDPVTERTFAAHYVGASKARELENMVHYFESIGSPKERLDIHIFANTFYNQNHIVNGALHRIRSSFTALGMDQKVQFHELSYDSRKPDAATEVYFSPWTGKYFIWNGIEPGRWCLNL